MKVTQRLTVAGIVRVVVQDARVCFFDRDDVVIAMMPLTGHGYTLKPSDESPGSYFYADALGAKEGE